MTNVDNLLGGVPKDMEDLDGIVKWYKSIKACKEFKDNADIIGGEYLGLAHSWLIILRLILFLSEQNAHFHQIHHRWVLKINLLF